MNFLDPRTDIAFKKLFGDMAHKNVLMSFLNSVLNRSEEHKIIDVTINDPHNVPDNPLWKFSIVDVRCTDQVGNQYIVEMQVSTQKDYGARAQYYSSLTLSRQLVKNEAYDRLVPVIFIGVLDFSLLADDSNYMSHHLILNKKTFQCSLHHLEFHFIELSKFNKTESELSTIIDQWTYLLKNAADFRVMPKALNSQEVQEALGILERGTWSLKELERYDREVDAMRVEQSVYNTAREEGHVKGHAEGHAEGVYEGQILLIKRMLSNHPIEEIVRITGFTREELECIKNENK